MKPNYIIIVLLIILFFSFVSVYSQCGCMGGAPVGGLTPVAGTTNIGILKNGNLRTISFLSLSNGNEYYIGDSPTKQGLVKNFKSSYLGLLVGYGILEDLTIDAEIGYYLYKAQDFGEYTLSGSGFSHVTVYGKYNAYSSRANEFEWTVGLGGRIPLNFNEQNLPQNIRSSTSAYGAVILSYLHKGYKAEGLHFFLVNRVEVNAENSSSYKYGSSFTNSMFITKSVFDKLTGMLEIRSDIKLKDSKYDEKNNDSGWNNLILSPQLNYYFGNLNISAFYDFPVYKYYIGRQLTKDYSIGFVLTWQTDM